LRLSTSNLELSQFHALPSGFSTLQDFISDVVDADTETRLPTARKHFSENRRSGSNSVERLSDLRLAAGLTQAQLAKFIGTSQPRLSLWEAGLDKPSFDNLKKMAVALGVDYNCLMGAIDDE